MEGGKLVSQPAVCMASSSSYSKGDVPMSLKAFLIFCLKERLGFDCLSEALSYDQAVDSEKVEAAYSFAWAGILAGSDLWVVLVDCIATATEGLIVVVRRWKMNGN